MLEVFPPKNPESKKVLKKTIQANRALAKLNGVAKIIPNQAILINSLVLQEAKDSSEVENIITTHDELYSAELDMSVGSNATKEVQSYREALLRGFDLVGDNGLLLKRDIVYIQSILEKNALTGEVIYTPPQDFETIENLLRDLENYINEPNEIDPLVNMAMIHYQFESIHPFYDGNGRTGRIINILYLVLKDLLDIPILYLSRYIIKNKADYYSLLQEVRSNENWEEWILYMLDGVKKTADETIALIQQINELMLKTKYEIREKLPKIYSKDLTEILFMHPYTKIDFLVEELGLHRQTASKYLMELERIGIVESIKIKNSKFFINKELFSMLKKGI